MGYIENERNTQKTIRIGILCILGLILGFLFFCYKIKACDKNEDVCRDEFLEISDGRYTHACSPGATAEMVMSPPSPKPGMICHCPSPVAKPTP